MKTEFHMKNSRLGWDALQNLCSCQREQYNFGHEIVASKCVQFLVPPPPILLMLGARWHCALFSPHLFIVLSPFFSNAIFLFEKVAKGCKRDASTCKGARKRVAKVKGMRALLAECENGSRPLLKWCKIPEYATTVSENLFQILQHLYQCLSFFLDFKGL